MEYRITQPIICSVMRGTLWLFMVTSTYRENTFMKISDRDHRYVIFTNRHYRDNAIWSGYSSRC